MVGLRGKEEMTVGREDLASFAGNVGAEVLSTARVILLMEQAARDAVEGSLPDGTITVGTRIDMRHFAATPLESKVRADARLMEIDGRRLVFAVTAYDDHEKISEGINERFIVSVNRFLEKVKKKRT
jgi:predicted thioesterase